MMELREQIQAAGRRIAVLSGGDSTEREISLVSGKAVAEALSGMQVPHDLFVLDKNRLPEALSPELHFILPVIHGTYGEDGMLSAELDQKGFIYAGCDLASNAICFDKLASKALAKRVGVPVANELLLAPPSKPDYRDIAGVLGKQFILKPRRDGSSVGLHLVIDEESYGHAEEDLGKCDYLAEAYLEGIDLTVGLLGGNPMGVVAVRPKGGLYDYAHKYTTGMSEYEYPARIDPVVANQLQQWAKQVHDVCGCRDIARVDFRMGTDDELIFLEINTLPGMTSTSLLPKSAQCEGLSFEDVITKWVESALIRIKETAA